MTFSFIIKLLYVFSDFYGGGRSTIFGTNNEHYFQSFPVMILEWNIYWHTFKSFDIVHLMFKMRDIKYVFT